MILSYINNNLDELIDLLKQLSNDEYSSPCAQLSNSSIGEHIRHIIELFQCLENQYESGVINYDDRRRNVLIQTDTDFAIQQIVQIQNNLDKENKNIVLKQKIESHEITTESNYYRELLYNFEHCIHHQALIKVAILQHSTITIDKNFGVARSTIEYRNQCVQ
ncbi:DinB family protein [Flavobacterium franklandianum]|uniref:DinB family protein n=1 Tax=Flavobacterium franklandianum TaxID=2594430 RepID=A0A553CQQ6_9FLAO|nr:DinB family protein [Flavobacterium franklandianum]TRX22873.1 DinB family protein [Flavobacterium franklandianum]TRX24980.1 DinB family protein [Flavobacterium franklandianum]